MRRLFHALKRDDGQVIFMVPMMFATFLIFGILIFDVGLSLVQRREYQNTSDKAALAAVVELYEDGGDPVGTGQTWLERNGFDTSVVANWEIDQLDAESVKVSVSGPKAPFWSELIGLDWDVHAYAIAKARRVPVRYSLMAMSPSDCSALWLGGQGSANISGGGGTYTNSTSDCGNGALRASGGGSLVADFHHIRGSSGTSGGGVISQAPTEGVVRSDPYADLVAPTMPGSCNNPSGSVLAPGCWRQKLTVSGGTVTLQSGLHIFQGGISVSAGSLVTDGPVVIYATCNPSPCNGSKVDISITGGDNVLVGPSEGSALYSTYRNVVIWVDRTAGSNSTVKLAGQGNSGLSGSIYNIGSSVSLAGGASGTSTILNISVVADKISIGGQGNITLPWNPITAPSEIQAWLAE